jgi:hypothetical protein
MPDLRLAPPSRIIALGSLDSKATRCPAVSCPLPATLSIVFNCQNRIRSPNPTVDHSGGSAYHLRKGHPGDRVRPKLVEGRPRKVRALQSKVPGNTRAGEPAERATEKDRLGVEFSAARYGEATWCFDSRVRVKRWCKRPPAPAAMSAARQPPPGARPSRSDTLWVGSGSLPLSSGSAARAQPGGWA